MSRFARAMGGFFREGMKLLDWGCGRARFLRYMDERLSRFSYWGVEPDTQHGRDVIESKQNAAFENRSFGLLPDSEVCREGLENADVCLLLSIFTHLDHRECVETLSYFRLLLARGGIVVYSIFLDAKPECGVRGGKKGEWYYDWVTHSPDDHDNMFVHAEIEDVRVILVDKFVTLEGFPHHVFVAHVPPWRRRGVTGGTR